MKFLGVFMEIGVFKVPLPPPHPTPPALRLGERARMGGCLLAPVNVTSDHATCLSAVTLMSTTVDSLAGGGGGGGVRESARIRF